MLQKNSILLFAFALFCFAFPFREVLYDNVLSRLDLTFALALRGTTRIDEYHANTLDKAFVNGHYYCDKAPGLSLAGAPVLAALRHFVPAEALRPENKTLHYFLVLILIGLPSAVAVTLLFKMMLSLSGNAAASLMAAVAYAAGTAALPYSTLFMDHQFAANLIVFAVFLLFPAFNRGDVPAGKLIVAGFLSGWAVVSEYPSAVSVAAVVCCFFVVTRQRAGVLWLFPGLIACAGLLAAYNSISFGSIFTIGYHHETLGYYREGMGAGLAGVTAPKLLPLLAILFMPERGLLWMSPFLMVGVFGFAAMMRDGSRRAAGVLCLAISLLRIITIAGYYEPWGGFSHGSRFLTGALPFLALPVAAGWTKMGTPLKRVLAALCFFSVAQALFLSAVEPRVPFMIRHPLIEYALALVRAGFEPASILRSFSIGFPAEWIAAMTVLGVFFVLFIRSAGANAMKYAVTCMAGAAVLSACYFAVADALPSTRQDFAAYYIGVALRQNGKFEAAETQLKEAVTVAKAPFPAARFALGITRVRLEKFSAAEEDFRLAIEEGLPGPQAHVSLGALYIIRGNFEGAEDVLAEGLSVYPSSPELNDLANRLRHSR